MKKIPKILLFVSSAYCLPMVSYAQQFNASGGAFGTLLNNILIFTSNTLIPFIVGIGFLFFVWGMFQYFIAGGANDEKKEKGKSLMIYATLGFVLIIIFWGVVNLLASSTGFSGGSVENLPRVSPAGAGA